MKSSTAVISRIVFMCLKYWCHGVMAAAEGA